MAFSLALTRIFEAGFESLPPEEQDLRRSMLTATTVLLLFTVFVQVRDSNDTEDSYMYILLMYICVRIWIILLSFQ